MGRACVGIAGGLMPSYLAVHPEVGTLFGLIAFVIVAMAGLTATEVKTAVDLILRIRENGVTLLVVEHIMEAIMPIADKVVVLDGGKKIADGPPNEIIEDEQVIKAYFGEKYSKRLKQERKNGQSPAQG